MNHEEFAAVLLAGGRSSRMGTNKASIEYEGMPMWRFQIDKLATLGSGSALLLNAVGYGIPIRTVDVRS